jgi:hypothetical protein
MKDISKAENKKFPATQVMGNGEAKTEEKEGEKKDERKPEKSDN